MVINPVTGHVSPQFHVVSDDECSKVKLMREGTTPPNLTDLVQHSSQHGALDNIVLRDNWFTKDIEEYTSKTPTHVPIVAPE